MQRKRQELQPNLLCLSVQVSAVSSFGLFTDSLEGHIPSSVLPSLFVLVWPHKDNGAEQTGAAILWEGDDATRMGKKLGILSQTARTGR